MTADNIIILEVGMTELELAMWRHRPQDAARINASLADPGWLIELTADEFRCDGGGTMHADSENLVPEKADGE